MSSATAPDRTRMGPQRIDAQRRVQLPLDILHALGIDRAQGDHVTFESDEEGRVKVLRARPFIEPGGGP